MQRLGVKPFGNTYTIYTKVGRTKLLLAGWLFLRLFFSGIFFHSSGPFLSTLNISLRQLVVGQTGSLLADHAVTVLVFFSNL